MCAPERAWASRCRRMSRCSSARRSTLRCGSPPVAAARSSASASAGSRNAHGSSDPPSPRCKPQQDLCITSAQTKTLQTRYQAQTCALCVRFSRLLQVSGDLIGPALCSRLYENEVVPHDKARMVSLHLAIERPIESWHDLQCHPVTRAC